MTDHTQIKTPVLIAGDSKLVSSVAVCLILAIQPVVILTQHILEMVESLNNHAKDINTFSEFPLNMNLVSIINTLDNKTDYLLAIALTNESLPEKLEMISLMETVISSDKTIAINTESISLTNIQKAAKFPERIFGTNWVEPAHTTYFLEIISNKKNDQQLLKDFADHAKLYWKKDPYIINSDHSIRARLMCAMIREAFYLVENGYVTFEDIDRACRNDAGYYLPFAGNFRYMDLMGTYIYGIVMKDMNPDLTRQQHVPAFFKYIVQQGWLGMDNNHGFYEYPEGEAEKWNTLSRNFSYQIRDIINKYHTVI
jgi:3-hydroxybutyryl-CoA dehydrogenase